MVEREMLKIKHRIGINGTVESIFESLTDPDKISRSRSTVASGEVRKKGDFVDLGFGGSVSLSFNTTYWKSIRLLQLECLDGPGPWKQSKLRFLLDEADDQVFLTFTHSSDLASEDDFLYFNTKWPLYLLSLRDLIETGMGRPSPHDTPIYVGDNVKSNT